MNSWISQRIDTSDFTISGGNYTVIIDLKSKFDRVPLALLMLECKTGIQGRMLMFIYKFCNNKKNDISQDNNSTSETTRINNGISHVSVLSPTLFNIIFSSLKMELSPDIHLSIFVDEITIWVRNKYEGKVAISIQNILSSRLIQSLFC